VISTPSFTIDAGKSACNITHHPIHPRNRTQLSRENTGVIFSGIINKENEFFFFSFAKPMIDSIKSHPVVSLHAKTRK
jgi:hypothetical protein